MQKKQGISLIVLVITIIVMIILAAAVVITLSNTGVIGRASTVVDLMSIKQVQILADTIWLESQISKDDPTTIKNKIIEVLGTEANKYDILVDEKRSNRIK